MANSIQTSLLIIALAGLNLTTLAGCGQMGPLYMPPPEASPSEEAPPAEQEPPAAEPAAATDGSQES